MANAKKVGARCVIMIKVDAGSCQESSKIHSEVRSMPRLFGIKGELHQQNICQFRGQN